MLVMLILFIELLSVFLCVFRVYGQKPKVDVKGIITFCIMYVILNAINQLEVNGIYMGFTYIFFFVYCLLEFRDKILNTILSVLLSIIFVAIIQFICMLIVVFLDINILLRTLLADIIVLLCVAVFLPYCKVNLLRNAICRKSWLTNIIISLVSIIIAIAVVINCLQHGFDMAMFLFGIPMIVIILFLILNWDMSIDSQNKIKDELAILQYAQDNYKELIKQVKINNHGIKNHMMALRTSEYMDNYSEEFIEKNREYCQELNDTNKYSKLLFLNDKTLAGFIYAKIIEAESKEIEIECKIETILNDFRIPSFELVEAIGILFDNAIEACEDTGAKKKIVLSVYYDEEYYVFQIANPFPETNYDEILSWFEINVSKKGKERGIGLYHAKRICNKYHCLLGCMNTKISNENYILFELKIKKDDI